MGGNHYNTFMENESTENVVFYCKYRVVWCSKYRRKVLVEDVKKRLRELLVEYAAQINVNLIDVTITPESVRITIEVDPRVSVHKAIKFLKAQTSNILRKEYKSLTTRIPTLWTNSYFICTIGHEQSRAIDRFLLAQPTSQRIKK